MLLAACSSPPTVGPSVLVLPGSGKTFDAFRADEAECRKHAQSQAESVSDDRLLQSRYDFAYQQCMYSRGHKIPAGSHYDEQNPVVKPPVAPPPPPPAAQPQVK